MVTLEDWYGFGHVTGKLRALVEKKLAESGIDPAICQSHPYTLCSIEELEVASQVMRQSGIRPFMEAKTSGEEETWMLSAFVQRHFSEQSADLRAMFPESWAEISPRLERGPLAY